MKPRYQAALWGVTIFLLLLTIIATAVLAQSGTKYSFLYSLPAFLLAGVAGYALLDTHRNRIRYVAQLSRECTEAELAVFQNLEMGLCVLDEDGILLHYNDYFNENILLAEDMFGKKLAEFLPLDTSLEIQELHWQDCYYQVKAVPYQGEERTITAFLWSDITELKKMKQDYQNSRPCVMLIVVDSYEDLIQNAKESVRLEVSAAIEKLLEQFISETNGILKRLKNDRFIVILQEEHVQQLMAEKFHILDEARKIHADDKNCVTFSIGVGHGADTMQESEAWAIQCLDMALGRGGDQAAVKTESGFRFFGGVSKGVEKKSRAKTRIIAGAIQELIQNSTNVYLMGHRFGDLDSIGSACGLAGAIRLMNIPVNVVVDPEKNLSKQLISIVEEELGKELFLTPQQAIDTITEDTLLIIVDTHNKDILESLELYQAAQKVIVIDHHRKNVNYVDNAVVFYHEPYASSACEMVTELLQYFKLNAEVNACCADCLLSGIMLDTKNFVMRTGVRTFEAAAYLKKIGADTVKVKGLFSGSIDSYRSRAEIVSSAEIIGCHAIAIAPEHTSDVRLVAPQAADELLSISNVDAAFVIYGTKESVSISARSLGAVNVQVIMEQLGGGGHQTMAATQIPNITPQEAKNQLLEVLAEFHKEDN